MIDKHRTGKGCLVYYVDEETAYPHVVSGKYIQHIYGDIIIVNGREFLAEYLFESAKGAREYAKQVIAKRIARLQSMLEGEII